jgi:hypothetical protein
LPCAAFISAVSYLIIHHTIERWMQ